jgi:hypothetical protein
MEYLSLSSSNISELDFIDRGLLLQKATEPKVPSCDVATAKYMSFFLEYSSNRKKQPIINSVSIL